MNIQFCLDDHKFSEKPEGEIIGAISKRIAENVITVTPNDLPTIWKAVGEDGQTICCPTFYDSMRSNDTFKQQQLFALDFDNSDPDNQITFSQAMERTESFHLPVLFAYETFSSQNQSRFRLFFLNDQPILHHQSSSIMLTMMGAIFPEADEECIKKPIQLYYGGKGLLYECNQVKTINAELVRREFEVSMEEKYGSKSYKRELRKFYAEHGYDYDKIQGVAFEEWSVVLSLNSDCGNSPKSNIYNENIQNGELAQSYHTEAYSTAIDCSKSSVSKKIKRNPHRSNVLDEMYSCCQLFRDYNGGEREIDHDELFGLMTNMIQVEGGLNRFLEICAKYPKLHKNRNSVSKWKSQAKYCKKNHYGGEACNKFCSYKDKCNHGFNILTTCGLKRRMMIHDPDFSLELVSLAEAQKETRDAITSACISPTRKIKVVKAQVGIGKSETYIDLMKDHKILAAVPTNRLKDEIQQRARHKNIKVMKTPSLDELAWRIPMTVYRHAEMLRQSGRSEEVTKYLLEYNKWHLNPDVDAYLHAKQALRSTDGNVVTTHRYLTYMDEKFLRRFDCIVVDEDILLDTIATGYTEVTIEALEYASSHTQDRALKQKVDSLLKAIKETADVYVQLDRIIAPNISDFYDFNIFSFCQASTFIINRPGVNTLRKEPSALVVDSPQLPDVPIVIVSGTVDEAIYRTYFPEADLNFTETHRAKFKGRLIQYYGKSMSRDRLRREPELLPRIQERLGISNESSITYKGIIKGNTNYLGNLAGINKLEGRDLLIVGSAYQLPSVYLAAAAAIGIQLEGRDFTMREQRVSHNGYEFRFMTFNDEELRKVQFWLIESELEQAIGRARLLHYDCTVHLCSNFAMLQALMIDGFTAIY